MLDTSKCRPARSSEILVELDGKLVTRWIPRIGGLPGLKPVWITRNEKIIQFETEDEADAFAKETAAKWRERARA